MLYQGVEVTKIWAIGMTVSAKVAKQISLNGRVPRHGYENKTTLTKPDPVELGKTMPMWCGRTFHDRKEYFWLH